MNAAETNKSALREAIRVLGSQSELARACTAARADGVCVKQGHVYSWLNSATSQGLPAEYVLAVEAATRQRGEQISRHALRCDVFGPRAEQQDLVEQAAGS